MAGITAAQIFAGLHYADGAKWTGGVVTFSVPNATSTWSPFSYPPGDEPSNADFAILNASQASAFRLAIFMWDRLVNLTFQEVQDNPVSEGQIRI
eukprot:gene31643-53980_t